ncbi:hypothetical protein LGT39_14010 [Demequina sp. TTPB684]|uniref:hypothetical protein n=1 Tax=unclassified Demequina TaxID=2620311 RepID=UPI001CF34D63|nr:MULTISPECIES: hypothetical protein [unclassified Demequina]MCB2413962.1 hypothetical protein [Demequina sp. TTPB684]UPU88685.1 hypothetical protein LGT36_001820 [Demequina sp. TMPB413]
MKRINGATGLSLKRALVTIAAAGLLALVPTGFTALTIAAADGYVPLACDFFAEGPDAAALDGKLTEEASGDIAADARPLLGRVDCTWRDADGDAYWTQTVHALHPVAVVGSYGLALAVVAVSWLTRPTPWAPSGHDDRSRSRLLR